MTEIIIPIPARLKNVAQGGHVAGSEDIDAGGNKNQKQVNDDVNLDIQIINDKIGPMSDNRTINKRLDDIEAAESITYEGGEAQIAQGSDFTNPDATKRAKIPTVGAIVDGLNDGIYDVSKRNPTGGPNSDGKFTLDYILDNANTLIPTGWRHGGMTISFVQSSDNKYVQCRLMSDEWSIDTDDWAIAEEGVYVENPEFVDVKTDAEGKILEGIKNDGSKYISGDLKVGGKIANEDLQEHFDSIEEEVEQVKDTTSFFEPIDTTEWLKVDTDSEGKILEGTKKNGIKVFNTDIEQLPLTQAAEKKLKKNLGVDDKIEIPNSFIENNIVVFDSLGNVKDSGYSFDNMPSLDAPKFVYDKTYATYQRIVDWAGSDDVFMLGFITDVHSGGTDKYEVVGQFSAISQIVGLDLLCNGGDIGLDTPDTTGDDEKIMALILNTKKGMTGHTPWVFLRGNHERLVTLAETGQVYNKSFNAQYHNMVFGDTLGNYGYIDYSEKKIRVYFLNTTDAAVGVHYGISVAQYTWLISSLSQVPQDYNVIVLTHYCNDVIGKWNNETHTILQPFKDILKDFANKASGSDSDTGLSWDFTSTTAQLVCNLCGDSHFNNYVKRDGVNYVLRQGYQSAASQMPEGATAPEVNYKTNCCFDVLAVKNDGNAKVFRIGAGGSAEDLNMTY